MLEQIADQIAAIENEHKTREQRLRNLFQAVDARMITVEQAVSMALMPDPVVIDDDGEY